jgi:hypothetical protein
MNEGVNYVMTLRAIAHVYPCYVALGIKNPDQKNTDLM